jgi:hypothetical protein
VPGVTITKDVTKLCVTCPQECLEKVIARESEGGERGRGERARVRGREWEREREREGERAREREGERGRGRERGREREREGEREREHYRSPQVDCPVPWAPSGPCDPGSCKPGLPPAPSWGRGQDLDVGSVQGEPRVHHHSSEREI